VCSRKTVATDVKLLLAIAFICLGLAPAGRSATKHWLGGNNGNWSVAGNWMPAGVPQNGDDLIFDFTAEEPFPVQTMHNDIVGLEVRRLHFCGNGWSVDGNELTLLERIRHTGFIFVTNTCGANSFTFFCPLKLGDQVSIGPGRTLILRGDIDLNGNDLFLNANEQMVVSGRITGTGNVIATVAPIFGGQAKITFDGPTGNTFSGKLTVRRDEDETGEVIFDKQFGHVVNDALLIGDRGFSANARPVVCKLARPHQIGDNAQVCVTGSSQFLLQGNTESIGSLCLTNNAGDTEPTVVDTGGSTLSVSGIIAVNNATAVVPIICGKLGLPGAAKARNSPSTPGTPSEPSASKQLLRATK
jgi:hypothetical protein